MRRSRRSGGRAGRTRQTPCRPRRRRVVIDALFGAGLDRPVEGLPRAMIEAMNAQSAPGRRRRFAERHQRHVRRRHGRRRQCHADGDVLPQKARPSAAAGPAALRRPIAVADIGIPAPCLTEIAPQDIREHRRPCGARHFPVPRRRGPQIRPRPRRRGFGPVVVDRRGAACGARRVTRGRGLGHHRQPARGAGRQCGVKSGRDGAAGRRCGRAAHVPRRPSVQCVRDRAGRRRR